MRNLLIITLLSSSLWAHEYEPIPWTEEKIESAHIQLEKASSGSIRNMISVPGKIVFHPDRVAYIIPKVSGVASSICKNLGDRVQAGDVLAVLESKEVAEAKSYYLSAIKKLDFKRAFLKNEESLTGISPKQDYLNSKLEVEEAQINIDLARQTLYSMGLSEEEVNKIDTEKPIDLRYYHIKSPIYGKVLQRNLTLGELVNNSTKIFTIANFDKVWVEISINQKDVSYLKEDLELDILGPDGKRESAKLYQFNPAIQEETRRAVAIAVLNNLTDLWKPGEYVTVNIQTELSKVQVIVPKTAIQVIHDDNMIFVKKDGHFVPREVTVGKMDENNVEILSGLEEGEVYAANNTFVIKAELEKEGAEHHH